MSDTNDDSEADRKPAKERNDEPRGNSLEDASQEAMEEIRRRDEGGGHAGTGDIG